MVRLTKTQIQALATEIAEEINVEIKKENKKITQEVLNSSDVKIIQKKLDKIKQEIQLFLNMIEDLPEISIQEYHLTAIKNLNLTIRATKLTISPKSIEDKIILATIEAKDLDSIIEKVKQKYL